ncbi:hypothetical protein KBB41_02330 [Candidatus Curtissbacteria bacterium]|nr:hypothetical protein [Candidatus Curtissbacteria bacterium]
MKKLFYSALVLILPFTVNAQPSAQALKDIKYDDTIKTKSVDDFSTLFIKYVDYAINLFWVLVVVYGVFAAFKYLTAKGDPKAADVASQMFKYTVIGACVALLATVIKEIAKSILGG